MNKVAELEKRVALLERQLTGVAKLLGVVAREAGDRLSVVEAVVAVMTEYLSTTEDA